MRARCLVVAPLTHARFGEVVSDLQGLGRRTDCDRLEAWVGALKHVEGIDSSLAQTDLLATRHCRWTGDDNVAQVAAAIDSTPSVERTAVADRVDLHEGLVENLHHYKCHQGGAAVIGLHAVELIGLVRAIGIKVFGKTLQEYALVAADVVGIVDGRHVFPDTIERLLIPQITLGAGIIGCLFTQAHILDRAIDERACLIAQTDKASPLEHVLIKDDSVAKVSLSEADAHVEWIAVGHPRTRHVTQFQHDGPARITFFEQYTAGARVTYVEHKIDRDALFGIVIERYFGSKSGNAYVVYEVDVICHELKYLRLAVLKHIIYIEAKYRRNIDGKWTEFAIFGEHEVQKQISTIAEAELFLGLILVEHRVQVGKEITRCRIECPNNTKCLGVFVQTLAEWNHLHSSPSCRVRQTNISLRLLEERHRKPMVDKKAEC